MSDLKERYERVKSGIPPHVTLVAVSKTRSSGEIQAIHELGHRDFGENKAQELVDKAPILPDDIRWHFIGHLQRNKVKQVVPVAYLIHSVDSMRLLDEVNKRAAMIGKLQNVLLQVHIADESEKSGFPIDGLEEILKASLSEHANIRIRGLMGMATHTEDDEQIAGEFAGLAQLFDLLKRRYSEELPDFNVLSMGMSGDAGIAIANGSNTVRIGSSIFGPRSY
jgi:pyridoxal phosphate enzyme (YggS family)